MNASAEMPKYKCHKIVHALKITNVKEDDPPEPGDTRGAARLFFLDVDNAPIYAPISVDPEFMAKHDPQPGEYLVVYKDGYRSISPAVAFEEGYTRI